VPTYSSRSERSAFGCRRRGGTKDLSNKAIIITSYNKTSHATNKKVTNILTHLYHSPFPGTEITLNIAAV